MTKLRKRILHSQKVDIYAASTTIEPGPFTGKEEWTPGAKIYTLERPSGPKKPRALARCLMLQESNSRYRRNEKTSFKFNRLALGRDHKKMVMDRFFLHVSIVLYEAWDHMMNNVFMG